MKTNLPVTGREVDYPADESLISSTDLKGRVTFANEGFCRVAKFELDELVGKSHNVVRHPDMPPAAFQNLWDEIKAGRPWVGAVKNRCKDGDHYWVDAHVTPIFRNGQVAGYESVRVKPDRALVRRAEKLYRRVWKGRVGFTRRFYHHTTVRLSLGFLALLGAMLAVQAVLPAPFGTWLAYAGAAVAGPLGIAVALRRLKRLGAHARRIADNPVTQKVYEGDLDEMAQAEAALHMLKANQRTILRRIGASAAHLQDVAHQGRDQVQQTTQTIAQQHAEVEQVATAMNEMSATVNEVARNTSQAAEAAHAANEEAHDGKRVLDRAIHSIDALTREVDNTANALEALSQQSGQIGSIINVIREIADQTNLLALNAAIEAARAGEQGRGFAVVADEVRSLAMRTQEATGQIQDMIAGVQEGTRNAVEAMEHSRSTAQESSESMGEAGQSLGRIADSVQLINDMNTQIATAVEEQSAVAEEINRNILNIKDQADAILGMAQALDENSEALFSNVSDQRALVQGFEELLQA